MDVLFPFREYQVRLAATGAPLANSVLAQGHQQGRRVHDDRRLTGGGGGRVQRLGEDGVYTLAGREAPR